jgi:hypothetical protein
MRSGSGRCENIKINNNYDQTEMKEKEEIEKRV